MGIRERPGRSKETVEVRSDAALVAEIRRGLSALRRGKAKLYTLEVLFDD